MEATSNHGRRIPLVSSLQLSDGKDDAAAEVRRRRAVLGCRTAAPPIRILLVLFCLFGPPPRLVCCLLPAHHLPHHYLVPFPPFQQPQDPGVCGLGIGAGAGGVCGFPRYKGARG